MIITIAGVDYTPDSQWLLLNRNALERVKTTVSMALNGAAHIEQAKKLAGVALQVGTLGAWLARTEFEQLQTLSVDVLTEFTLAIDGQNFTVVWDHSQGPAVSGVDLTEAVGGSDTVTSVVLKFLTTE